MGIKNLSGTNKFKEICGLDNNVHAKNLPNIKYLLSVLHNVITKTANAYYNKT